MPNNYKNIVITPNISNTADPKIQFSGANSTVNTDISLYVYPASNGTLSFEGAAGQLFSITNDLSNSLFAVSDVSGIPSIEIFANGLVSLIPISGNVVFGAANAGIIANTTGAYVSSNSTVNATHTAALLQVSNSTSTANLTALDLKIGTTVVNSSQITATLLAANLSGSYANLTGQVNAATFYATTTANVGANVSLNTTAIFVGNSTVNADMTSSLVQVTNSTSTANLVATGLQTYTNSTVNSTVSASLVQVSNSTSTANLTALDLKIGATTVVNSTQVTATLVNANLSGSYANITGQVNTATLYAATSANVASATLANATGVYTTGVVNASTFSVGTAFTANSTVANAVAYYSGTLLVANTTVINATHLAGYTLAAPSVLGSGTANGASLTYANVSGQVNTATLLATTSANVGANVQLTTSALTVGNSTVNTTYNSALMQVANSTTTANVTAAGIQAYTNSTVNAVVTASLVQVSNSTATSNLTAQGLAAGANVVANTTTLKVGNTTFTTTAATLGGTLSANGSTGTATHVLTSGGAGNVYWASAAAGSVDQTAQYNWSNVHTFSSNVSMTGNVGIGGPTQTYTRLYVNNQFAFDGGYYQQYTYYGDSNGTMTAARTKVGAFHEIYNFNQNKDSLGTTTYDSYYYGQLSQAYNGSGSSSQNSYAYEVTGGKFTAYQYANGSAANTINNLRGLYGQAWLGSQNGGTVNNAYGSINQIYVPSTTVTGTVNAAYGVFSQVDSNTNVTINNSYLFYGSRRGAAAANSWGIYLTGEANNYISGNTYFNSNVAIGQAAASDTRFRIYGDFGVDFSSYGIFGYYLNTNTALTAARNRYGIQVQLPNYSQNKNVDGVTTYSTVYRAVVGDAWNGDSSTGGDARAHEMIGGNFRTYQYATGSNANTLTTGKGSQNQFYQYGSGIVTTAYGTISGIYVGNGTVTGNIGTAFGMRSTIDANSGPAQIGLGYLFYGDYQGTNTATKYGVYITGESNNYFSSNVRIQGATYHVGNVGIGINAQTDTQLDSGITWTSDAGLWNTYIGTTDANVTTTAARTKYGLQQSMVIVNQNRSSDGLTQYQPTYRGIDSRIYHGNTTSGGDAYAEEIQAMRSSVYLYSNGATANGANNVKGVYSYIQHAGGGSINAISGFYSYFEPTNATVTGSVANVTAFQAFITGNTGVSVANGYLFKGDYGNSNKPTIAYGIYITDETDNYLSGNLQLGANVAIGQPVQTDATLYSGVTMTGVDYDASNYYNGTTDSNSTMTAARTKHGVQVSFSNQNQNKDVTGATTYNANYRGGTFNIYNGTLGGNAYSSYLVAVSARAYQYAGGSSANTVQNLMALRGEAYVYGTGTGVTSNAFGTYSRVAIGNTTATGNISNAYGVYSEISSNTLATISTGYLFFGNHVGATTTTKYGVYITGEANNYFSGDVTIGADIAITGNLTATGTVHTLSGNVNVDAGVFFVDGLNNRVGINNTAPAVALQVTGAANLAGNVVIGGNASILQFLANAALGTAGQVLASGGAGSNVYWRNAPAIGIKHTHFAANGTFTKDANCLSAIVYAVGAGGGGGGSNSAATAGGASSGAGGGGGGCAVKILLSSQIGTTSNVTVGIAGSGSASGVGAATGGSNSTFANSTGGLITGTGGGAATSGSAAAPISGGSGGTGVNGDLNFNGQVGGQGWANATNSNNCFGGYGGAAALGFGQGGSQVRSSTTGFNGLAYGGGGSGSASANSGTTARAGGNGSQGLVWVIEYYST